MSAPGRTRAGTGRGAGAGAGAGAGGGGGRLGYQPSLDGVRAFAVLGVMFFHASPNVGGPDLVGGFLGVDVFFVLSGYLITSLLLREWDSSGGIKLGNFYARRGLRLLPALLVTIAFGALVVSLAERAFDRPYWESALASLSYVANWFQVQTGLAPLGHTWSLAIEEQYYLVWPALLILGLRSHAPRRALAAITFAMGLSMAFARLLTFEGGNAPLAALSTLTRPDGVLIGSALALFLTDVPDVVRRVLARREAALLAVAALLAAFFTLRWNSAFVMDGGLLLVNLITAVLVGHLVVAKASSVTHLFARQPFPVIGRISYGLYLFHVPVLHLVFGHPPRWQGIGAVAAMFALTFAIAGASYLLLEAPVLRLKKRFGSVSELSEAGRRQLVGAR